MTDRYGSDVLAPDSSATHGGRPTKVVSTETALEMGMVVEDAASGFCGAVVRWENGLVVLEDRRGRRKSYPFGAGFLLDGAPVAVHAPKRRAVAAQPGRTASGSVAGATGPAKVALPSRIYVEGRHDAELVEKVWGDDLRHEGVVVEYLGGVDDLVDIVAEFRPERGRRLGVLVDHLVPGSKESKIAAGVRSSRWGSYVLVTGHPFVDIWQAVKPARLGLPAWPSIPRGQEWKHGICAHFGWPHHDQADVATAWRTILGRVNGWADLERPLLTEVETLIDFVTQDHQSRD
ncbi:MAG: DUF3097 domain-containing protein [Propionibacteriaceae bacterium]